MTLRGSIDYCVSLLVLNEIKELHDQMLNSGEAPHRANRNTKSSIGDDFQLPAREGSRSNQRPQLIKRQTSHAIINNLAIGR